MAKWKALLSARPPLNAFSKPCAGSTLGLDVTVNFDIRHMRLSQTSESFVKPRPVHLIKESSYAKAEQLSRIISPSGVLATS